MSPGWLWSGEHMIMLNVTWRRFDQSAKQLIVGHTTNGADTNKHQLLDAETKWAGKPCHNRRQNKADSHADRRSPCTAVTIYQQCSSSQISVVYQQASAKSTPSNTTDIQHQPCSRILQQPPIIVPTFIQPAKMYTTILQQLRKNVTAKQ